MTPDDALISNLHSYWKGYDTNGSAPDVPGLVTYSFGVPDVQLNGVLQAGLDRADVPAVVDAVARHYRDAGLPAVWWVGPASRPADLGDRLAAAGVPPVATLELMAVELATLPDEAPPTGLVVRAVADHEVPAWAGVVASEFGLVPDAVEPYRELEAATPATPRYERFGGWLDDELVATAAVTTDAAVAGVFTVATLDRHRGKGYGRALTLAALHEGRVRGLGTGGLQATSAGLPVYRRLGFDELGTFTLHALPE